MAARSTGKDARVSRPLIASVLVLALPLFARPAHAKVPDLSVSDLGALATASDGVVGTAKQAGRIAGVDVDHLDDLGEKAAYPYEAGGVLGFAIAEYAQRTGYNDLLYFTYIMYAGALAPLAFALNPGDAKNGRAPRGHKLDSSIYTLAFEKKSALTGALQRQPSGLALGYDFKYQYVHPDWGWTVGADVTWQQTNIDESEFIYLTGFFAKLDLPLGADLARLAGHAAGSSWLKRQRLMVRAGPSAFWNWIRVGDYATDVPLAKRISDNIGLASGYGFAFDGELDVELVPGIVRGVGRFERGQYPKISTSKITGNQGALLAIIAFDDLRGAKSYTWQRLAVGLDFPIGQTAKSLGLAGDFSRLETNSGTGVSNRGVSIKMKWRW